MAVRVTDNGNVKLPTARKYEAGTAIDFHRQYRDQGRYGEVLELKKQPSVMDINRMIDNDAMARQLFSAVRAIVKGARWKVVAGKGDKGERDFVEWALWASPKQGGMTTPMRTVIGQMANAIAYRSSAFEKVWKVAERGEYKGFHILHKLGYRPPSTVTMKADANGSFNGFVQRAYKGNNHITMPFAADRSLVYIHGFEEAGINGYTPFDVVYKNYLNKMKVAFFYFAFLENVAFPRTLVKVSGDDPDELQYLLDKARLFASQGVMGLYDTEEIESYESQRNTRDYQSALEYLNWEMARALLGQFLDLGTSGERGSYALSKDKSSFFFNTMEVILQDIAASINDYVVADMVHYNFGRDATYPWVQFEPLNDESASEVLETYRNIVMANAPNITPDFMLKLMNRVEEILGLEINPLEEYDDETYLQILKTIPTAREHLLSKESRAGSGQNPVTGLDKNNNNLTPQQQEAARNASRDNQISALRSQGELLNDDLSIVNMMRAPTRRSARVRRLER